jgi:hypothetical protein
MLRYVLCKSDSLWYWFFQFYYEAFAAPLLTLSKQFLSETDTAIDELLYFQEKVQVCFASETF